jgi:hypothetical protein
VFFLAGKNSQKIEFSLALRRGAQYGKAHCDLDFHEWITGTF